jgi:putative ABC transport system permease protein
VQHIRPVDGNARNTWAGVWLERLLQDVRFGLRTLWRTPAFTVMAVLCLALGIGANAAVFSWMEGILLRPYPGVAAQDRLVAVAGTMKGTADRSDMSWLDYKDLERSSSLFSSFIVAKIIGATITEGDRAERVVGQLVSANYFSELGVRPVLGRGFTADEEIGANAHPVTVISYRMWQERFSGDRGVLGQTIIFNRVPHTIIGVAPEAFLGTFVGYSMQFWVPPSMQAVFNGTYMLDDRSARWIEGLARLAPGVTIAQAQVAMSTAASRLEKQYPEADRGRGVRILPLWDAPFDNAKELLPMIRVAFVVVVFVLLIACANVANLMLVRAFARRQEMTVRLTLGARRDRLLRQLITEGALLSVLATAVGLLFAFWGRRGLVVFFAPRAGVSLSFVVALDWRVLAITAGLGMTTTLLFALVPALRGTTIDLAGALKADSRSAAGGAGGTRVRSGLVMLQVSMSFLLLVAAGLLIASMQSIRRADPGFTQDEVLTTWVGLLSAGYDTTRARMFAAELMDQLRAKGGVESVVLARYTPFEAAGPFGSSGIATDSYRPALDEQPVANFNAVSPGYFSTLGIPIVRGRDFTRADDDTTAPVAIVSETMAAKYWPNADPVGKRLQSKQRWMQVVGVAKDIKYQSLLKPPRPLFYVPIRQTATVSFNVHIKTRSGAAGVRSAYASVLRGLDPNIAPEEIVSLRETVERSTSTQRIASTFLGVFACLALALAAMGLYGVMSYVVSQSTRELGLRMALGAAPHEILRLVMSRGLALATIGVAIGLAAAAGTTRLLGDLRHCCVGVPDSRVASGANQSRRRVAGLTTPRPFAPRTSCILPTSPSSIPLIVSRAASIPSNDAVSGGTPENRGSTTRTTWRCSESLRPPEMASVPPTAASPAKVPVPATASHSVHVPVEVSYRTMGLLSPQHHHRIRARRP